MFDDFTVDIQAEEMNFWNVLANMACSLPDNEREEIVAEIVKSNENIVDFN